MSNSKKLLVCFLPALLLAAQQPPHGPANGAAANRAATVKERAPKRTPSTLSVSFTRPAADTVHVLVNNQPFTDFLFKEADNKPYLHPLRSASGKVVSRHFPMENVPGEDREHPHHRGIAFTHGDVNGYNFWASEQDQKDAHQGRILLDKIIRTQGGTTEGILEAAFRWVTPQGDIVLREHRVMTFYAHPSLRIIDFDIQLTAAGSPVRFGDTKEGSFYVRLGRELSEDTGGTMISSTGAKSEKNVWGHQANWVDDYGTVEGKQLGVAIFDHPGNPRHPTYWHSRAYGLMAVNIFGLHDFLNDKTKDGSLTLKPAETLRFRYRVVVHPGDTAAANIARLYDEYCRKAGDNQ